MIKKRVKISSIVENQLPLFVREEYPLISTFLGQYYKSLDSEQGSTYDILQNIDQYIKLDNITNLIDSTKTTVAVEFGSTNISVISTNGFPDNNGLIDINGEIILYESKNEQQFLNCSRGFSGITSYKTNNKPDQLTFSTSTVANHATGSTVLNLSVLLLKEFFTKVKKQIVPGFENTEFYSDSNLNLELNERNFITHSKDFYSSKGTDASFEILFKALYGDPATVIKPRDYLIRPSDAEYRITKDIIVESILGDPNKLYNLTLFQKQSQGLKETFGTVTKVEEIRRNNKVYYNLSLDFDYDRDISVRGTIFGDFSIHAKTKALETIKINATSITVDSTIGFPDSGELITKGISGNDLIIRYESKNVNQFVGCSGITEEISLQEDINLNVYAYSILNEEEIRVRILGVIKDLELPENNKYYEKGDIISFSTLGKVYDGIRYSKWITETPNTYLVSKFESVGINQIRIYTHDKNLINPLDQVYVEFFDNTIQDIRTEIFDVVGVSQDANSIFVVNPYQISKIYQIRKAIKKYENINGELIVNNVQNVYVDRFNDVYITSQGIPDYVSSSIEDKDFSINFFGLFQSLEDSKNGISCEINNQEFELNTSQVHDFKNGDSVFYIQNFSEYTLNDGRTINLNIYDGLFENQIYYVESISDRKIKLYKSRSNIYFNRYNSIKYNRLYSSNNLNEVSYTYEQKVQLLAGSYFLQTNEFVILFDDFNNIEIWYYTYNLNQWEKITSQITAKLYKSNFVYENSKKILTNSNSIKKLTLPEIPLEFEETTFGTTGILVNGVEILNYKSDDFVYYGPIEKIEVASPGNSYDVINLPSLEVSPENTTTRICKAHVEVTGKVEEINVVDGGFDILDEPTIKIIGGNGKNVEIKANLISFKHEVDFNPIFNFVNLSENTISFSTYHKFRDYEEVVYDTNGNTSVGGISTLSSYFVTVEDDLKIKLHKNKTDALNGVEINLTSFGDGTHKLSSKQEKRKIASVTILNSGEGYKNNYIPILPVGINTYNDIILAKNHGYSTGDVVNYNCLGTPVEGLNQSKYYVTKVNDDSFKLSYVGIGSTSKDFYYNTNQYVNLKSSGIGTHIFQHEPILIQVSARTGISSYSKELFTPILSPIFRGEISNVYIEDGGVGYGSSEILNYEKQPNFTLKSGKNAQLIVNVLNGKVIDVYVLNGGSDYYSLPQLVVRGTGIGCILTPVLENGSIKKVIVVNGGSGYEQKNTIIDIINLGTGAAFNAKIKSWNLNSTSRILNSNQLKSNDDGALYSNTANTLKYCHLYCPYELRKKIYSTFLDDNGNIIRRPDYENSVSTIKYHSPIIGWAYDGNPIYGPYGYKNPYLAGQVKKIKSGYSAVVSENRPPEKIGDRIIFPYGAFIEDYAFTSDGDLDEFNGRYCVTPEYPNGVYAYFTTISSANDFVPEFPYFIGNKFKSKKILDNFNSDVNQNTFDFTKNKLTRNTYYYALTGKNSSYDFLLNPAKDSNQNSKITSIQYSRLDSIGIITSGNSYSVGDVINFDNSETNGFDASAIIDSVVGKSVQSIQNNLYSISDIELYKSNQFIGICTSPHQLKKFDYLSLISNYNLKLNSLVQVGVSSHVLTLTSDVNDSTTTGIVTEFQVYGNLEFPSIFENDYYQIENETIKILKVDKERSKIKVLRSPSGTSHLKNLKLTELTRKFTFDLNEEYIPQKINREFYFDPTKVVGFGTTSGSTVEVDYVGTGKTNLFIPPGNLYFPNHNLDTNTPLVYSTNGGNPIVVSNGSTVFNLNTSNPLYSIKLSDNFIGISSNKVAIGTDNNYVGIGTTTSFLYVTNLGLGVNHSLKTNYTNVIKLTANKNSVVVSTSSTHGLRSNDLVDIDVKSGISTTIKIEYNDYNRRLVFNKKYFSSINILDNVFTITNHGYSDGQELLYISETISSELIDNQIYFVILIDKDKFQLCKSIYDYLNYTNIDFTSSCSGYFYEINAKIEATRNQKIIFDLSHPSLAYNNGLELKSAFDFNLYYDEKFNKEYYKDSNDISNVFKFGNIGLSLNARVEFQITDNTPNTLYYNLIPSSNSDLPQVKKELVIEGNKIEFNKISIVKSKYSGNNKITVLSPSTFSYQIKELPEISNYTSDNSYFKYTTDSKTAFGPINSIKLVSGGNYYTKIPGISSITSQNGSNAVLYPISNHIGRIKSTKLDDIGYGYSIDPTIKPCLDLPKVLRIEPFSAIDQIKTTFKGKFYNYSPTLVVLDSVTNQIQDVILDFNYLTGDVQIIQNSSGFNDTEPKIVSTNNSNGIGINSITYDPILKRVTATLNYNFTNPDTFPVDVNDKIFVEDTTTIQSGPDFITDGVIYKGYNSSDYNYSTFNVVGISTAIDDDKAYITYYIGDVINGDEIGTFDPETSKGSIVPVKNMPTFDVKIKKNSYIVGEKVESNGSVGIVNNWNPKTNYIKIQTTQKFDSNSILVGKSSGSLGKIQEILDLDGFYEIDYYSIQNKGWKTQTGFLNVNSQRVHDNDYYQYFSYSIKSRVSIDKWEGTVNSLNHTSGFKKFGDLSVESETPEKVGMSTDQNFGNFTGVSDLNTIIDLETTYDFDLASEENVFILNSQTATDEITLNSTILQDYSQSVGNRVLVIDDISGEFNTNRKSTLVTAIDI